MQELQQRLEALRRRNIESRYFIADSDLFTVVEEESIQVSMGKCSFENYERREFEEAVKSGGKKVFAILTLIGKPELIAPFIRNDQLQNHHLDQRLPYSYAELLNIIPQSATKFCEMQWELLPPLFSKHKTHRVFHDDTILPFVNQEWFASGGFGEIYEMSLEARHQELFQDPPSHVRSTFGRRSVPVYV